MLVTAMRARVAKKALIIVIVVLKLFVLFLIIMSGIAPPFKHPRSELLNLKARAIKLAESHKNIIKLFIIRIFL